LRKVAYGNQQAISPQEILWFCDQLLKLETLGLTEEEAEDCILKGFLA